MKRLIYIISLLSLVFLSACTKESETLSGTSWSGAETGALYLLTFTQNEFTFTDEVSRQYITGDYIYEPPVITLVAQYKHDPDGKVWSGGGSFTGRVSGKTLTLTVGTSSITLIRK